MSNGRIAKSVGNGADNYVDFNYVWASHDGQYNFDLKYISGENRDVWVKINGGTPIKLRDLNSGSWSKVGSHKFNAKLRKGNNTIRLYNPRYYAPDIDKLIISENI